MVSLWPWKGDDTSPASFEKTLSNLSDKITKQSTKLDSLRQRSRRYKALWTLYTTFAYLLYSIILALVVGWRNWALVEYGAIAGGPIVIYAVRLGLTTYYSYRTSTVQSNLDVLQKQREATIDKLKTATKYNTTQELLKKYGGTPTPKGRPQGSSTPKPSPNSAALKGGRTAGVPPPTANIPGRNLSTSFQSTPERSGVALQRPLGGNSSLSPTSSTLPRQQLSTFSDESADFAPNAFSSSPQYVQPDQGSRWYDRIMDVLLGEDEMLPKNRLALICSHCRLVNGQASPGVKRLEDVGKWRCSGCGIMNGQETDAEKIVANIKDQASSGIEKSNVYLNSGKISGDDATMSKEANVNGGHESDVTQYSENSEVESGKVEIAEEKVPEPLVEDEPPRRRVGRPKGSGKKAN